MEAPEKSPVRETIPIDSGRYGCALAAIAIAGIVLGMIFVCAGWGDLRELEEQTSMPAKKHDEWLRAGRTALGLGWINLIAGAACLRWHALHGVPAIAAITTALGWAMWALSLT